MEPQCPVADGEFNGSSVHQERTICAKGGRSALPQPSSVSQMISMDGYELLGHGPSATGPGTGWRMRADLFAKCVDCGDMLSLDPNETARCSCGSLSKDADTGRFGSIVGDGGIAIYRQR